MKIKLNFQDIGFFITAILLISMVIIVFIQIIFRHVLNAPLSWPEEISRWLLVWITFGGAEFGFKNGGLISIDYFVNKFPSKIKSKINLLNILIMLGFYSIFAYSGYFYMLNSIKAKQLAPVTKIPTAYLNSAIVIGSLFVIIAYSIELIKQIRIKGE